MSHCIDCTSIFNNRSSKKLITGHKYAIQQAERISSRAHNVVRNHISHRKRERHEIHPSLKSFRYARRVWIILALLSRPPSRRQKCKNSAVIISLHFSCHVSLLLLFVVYFIARTTSNRKRCSLLPQLQIAKSASLDFPSIYRCFLVENAERVAVGRRKLEGIDS